MDRRDRMAMTRKPRLTRNQERMIVEVDNGLDLVDVELPCKMEVCYTCEGKGSHVNPSIDAHGLSAEDFYDDPDFAEDYFSGAYDMPCNECGGRRVVPVPDEDRMNAEEKALLKAYYQALEDEEYYQMEREAERRMGA